ncbi:MAG: hypothetical protein ACE5IP_07350 [Terriglobia bacterium]
MARSERQRFGLALVVGGMLAGAAIFAPAGAQSLAQPVLRLYPAEAGEVVFVDLQATRRSPYYAQLKEQVLPERVRDLAGFAARLGVDFDRNVDQLSWAFVKNESVAGADLMGVAEGTYFLEDVQRAAAAHQLGMTMYRGTPVYVVGKNERGKEFVFAFRDNATCLFGFRRPVVAMLDRAADGGPSLLNNAEMRALVEEVNQRAAIWLVLNGEFTQLGVRQFLGRAARVPGAEGLAGRVRSASVRIELTRGLESTVAARCATATDALWFSAFLQGALFLQRQQLNDSNPTLARVLADAELQRENDRLSLALSIPERDLITLIQSNSLTLRF